MGTKARIEINSAEDLANLRGDGLALAKNMGLNGNSVTTLGSVLSELARFIVDHSLRGEIILESLVERDRRGLQFSLTIDAPSAVQGAKSPGRRKTTARALPSGITRFKSIMDEFEMPSASEVVMTKWFR